MIEQYEAGKDDGDYETSGDGESDGTLGTRARANEDGWGVLDWHKDGQSKMTDEDGEDGTDQKERVGVDHAL